MLLGERAHFNSDCSSTDGRRKRFGKKKKIVLSPFKLSGVGRERRIALMSEEDESKRNDASKLFTPCKCGKGGWG